MNYLKRLKQLQALLPTLNSEAILIENPINLLYLTGLDLSAGKLVVTQTETALIVDGRYFESCQALSPCPIFLLEEMPLKKWFSLHPIQHLAFESDKTTYQSFLNLKNTLSCTLVPVESPIQRLRWIKDADEIDLLRTSAKLAYEGYEFVASRLQEGVKERDLALDLEFFWKKKGAKGLAFESIIAFGANSSMPHYRAGEGVLKSGMPVLIDIGVIWRHYHSDMTRVLFFGEPPPIIRTIFTIVEEAKQAAQELCKPGTCIGDLDAAARDYITERGYGKYFTHSLGHGLGLEIHESPTLRSTGPYRDTPLQEGMVITIEPGIYLPQIGGVRLEDTLLITSEGYENLTNPIPKI